MNDFIDDTVVLPAGNWDKDLLLPVLRIQNEKVKERKLRQEIALRWNTDPKKKPIATNEDSKYRLRLGHVSTTCLCPNVVQNSLVFFVKF